MAPSYNKGSVYMLKLIFNGALEPWECFEKLFRTLDMKRLNGAGITGVTRKGVTHEKMHYVKIKSKDFELLNEAAEIIKSTDEMMEHILYKEIEVSPYRSEKGEILLASIENSCLKQEYKGLDALVKGYEEAKNKGLFETSVSFKEIPCEFCGSDTKGFGFCPSCGKQVKHISVNDFFILGAMTGYLVILTVISLKNIWPLPWDSYKIIFTGISLLRAAGYLSGLVFTYNYRKIGYYILLGTKIADSFIRMTAFGTNFMGFALETAGTLIFIYIIKWIVEKHLPYMRKY